MGSSLGNLLRLNYKTTTLLIGCGAAGAMASIFTTPIAAVVFSLEVLMLDLTISSIIPLLMASAMGAITTKFFLAEKNLVHFDIPISFEVSDVIWFLILGIITGLVSLYFNKMSYLVSDNLERIKNRWKRVLVGGAIIGVLLFLFPALYGEGYETIRMILKGHAGEVLTFSPFYEYRDNLWIFTLFMLFLVLTKVIAMSLTISAGGVGGIFAPSAVTGGYVGFVFARFLNETGITRSLSESSFTLVGMAGVLGAVLHAPLTSIFLIAEMTDGYELIVPLMLTSTISFITIKTFDPHSIFTKRLAERGELLTHHKDKAVLTLLSVRDVIDKDLLTIHPDATLGDLTKVIAKSKRNLFPVVDEDNLFIGLVVMDDVREDMFKKEKYDTPVTNYMLSIPAGEKVSIDDSMEIVMEKFNRTGHYNLVVLDKGKYVGFVSRANVFNAYRQTLIDVSQE
jgi:CIC family chloride channel protein